MYCFICFGSDSFVRFQIRLSDKGASKIDRET